MRVCQCDHHADALTGGALTRGSKSQRKIERISAFFLTWSRGAQVWGSCLNRSRDIMRQGMTWFHKGDADLKAQLLRYTVAFAVATKVHLRADEDMRTELEQVLERTWPLAAMWEASARAHCRSQATAR
jgi:predicted membrane chloride channel (bestrophin family)